MPLASAGAGCADGQEMGRWRRTVRRSGDSSMISSPVTTLKSRRTRLNQPPATTHTATAPIQKKCGPSRSVVTAPPVSVATAIPSHQRAALGGAGSIARREVQRVLVQHRPRAAAALRKTKETKKRFVEWMELQSHDEVCASR